MGVGPECGSGKNIQPTPDLRLRPSINDDELSEDVAVPARNGGEPSMNVSSIVSESHPVSS